MALNASCPLVCRGKAGKAGLPFVLFDKARVGVVVAADIGNAFFGSP